MSCRQLTSGKNTWERYPPRKLTAGYPKWWFGKGNSLSKIAIFGIYVKFLGCKGCKHFASFQKINMGKSWQIYCTHCLQTYGQIMINLPIFNPYLAWGAIMKTPSNLNVCFRDYAKTCQEMHNVWCRQYPQDMAQKQIPYVGSAVDGIWKFVTDS